jgi:acyl-CoA synthetase (AMP-forming)/AMP-acid ligase II/acyl carrier protein
VNRLEADAASPRGPGSSPATPSQLLAVITAMLSELRGGEVPLVTLDDNLESRLGIDSLARMEVLLRLEKAFAVRMPEPMVEQARTPRDLLRALAAASPRQREEFGPLGAAEPVPSAPDGLALPHRAGTLIEVLQWHADRSGDRVHVSFLGDSDAPLQRLTHAVLLERAQKVAAGLQRSGLAPGESVALMLPTSLGFFEAFAGILLAGGVPIPIYPPFRASQIEDHLRRQAHILDNGRAVLLISDERARLSASILRAGVPALRSVFTIDRLLELGGTWHPGRTSAQDTALLQYTSGSTGQPKGVVLTHANLLANIRVMGQALKATPGDVFVSWLPLYHDMGLIGAWMGSLYHGMPLFVMPPQAFLARPSRWLQALHRHRGTLSAAPNFAYEILATKVPDDELEGLDLSAWRVAANGAEPVHAATLTRFAERFRPYGFDPRSMMPMYGLAESGVGLAFPSLGRGPRIDCIDRRVLNAEGRAEPVSAAQAPSGMQIVCCGQPLAGHEIRVVDVRGAEVPERREGRIEFRGPSASAGYFHNADATRALFRDDWLDTGDVGYVAEGEIYLTSRVKDLIIRGGHNIHPYDLEEAVGNLQGVRQGCVAVFGAADPMSSTDRVVVLAETRTKDPGLRAGLRERIAALSIALLGVPADEIVLAEPRTVLKTSSGKIRRAACRTLYEQGRLRAANRSVGWQVARLELDAIARRLREPLQRALNALYAGWAWTLFGLLAAVAAPIALLPRRGVRKRAARAVAKLVVQTAMLPLHVQGADRLKARPAVVVVNHASYVDWLVLTAVLPPEMSFVAKSDLARFRPLRWVLSRMGTRFVERDDVHASVEDARALLRARAGGRVVGVLSRRNADARAGLGRFPDGSIRGGRRRRGGPRAG